MNFGDFGVFGVCVDLIWGFRGVVENFGDFEVCVVFKLAFVLSGISEFSFL